MVLDRLKRFVRLCECLVLELLQRLVMRAVSRLEHCIRRAVGGEEVGGREGGYQEMNLFTRAKIQRY